MALFDQDVAQDQQGGGTDGAAGNGGDLSPAQPQRRRYGFGVGGGGFRGYQNQGGGFQPGFGRFQGGGGFPMQRPSPYFDNGGGRFGGPQGPQGMLGGGRSMTPYGGNPMLAMLRGMGSQQGGSPYQMLGGGILNLMRQRQMNRMAPQGMGGFVPQGGPIGPGTLGQPNQPVLPAPAVSDMPQMNNMSPAGRGGPQGGDQAPDASAGGQNDSDQNTQDSYNNLQRQRRGGSRYFGGDDQESFM